MSDYVSVGWDTYTLLSGKNMNQMGTIYAAAKTHVDVHDHDSEYYSQADILAKCYSGGTLKPDADKIDGKHWDELITDFLPIGFCCFWDLTDEEILDSWHICDGGTYNGITTPDARGRLVLGAGVVHAALSSGGAASLSDCGGTVTIEGHILTVAEIPSHYHKYLDRRTDPSTGRTIGWYSAQNSELGEHSDVNTYENHPGVADGAHDHGTLELQLAEFSIMPPYLVKTMICKVA